MLLLGWLTWRRVAVLGFLITHQAEAQIINQYFPQGIPGYDNGLGVTVQSRARDEYVAPGIQLGDIVLKPVISEGIGFNSNVVGMPKAQSSLQMDTSLLLQASTDWTRNGLFTYLSVDQLNFSNLPTQNQLSWIGALGGTHDFGRDQLQFSYSHFNLQQTATDIGSLNFQTPETFHVDDVRTFYKVDLGRFTVTPGLQITNSTFDEAIVAGQPNTQQYRDHVLMVGSVAIRYEFVPQRNGILIFNGYNTHYTNQQLGQPARSNFGTSILAGLEYTANGVFRYRGLIGFEQRTYANNSYSNQGALIGEGEVIWTPSGLTTITLSVTRAIEDAASESFVGYVYTTGRVTIDHEYRKNILLQASTGIQEATYQQDGGSQTIGYAGCNVTWLLNHNMRLIANYNYAASTAKAGANNFAGTNYRQSIALIRLSFAF